MEGIVYCLVDPTGAAYLQAGAASYAEVAASHGLDEAVCERYRFDLTTRHLFADSDRVRHAAAARTCLEQLMGTPDRLMAFAEAGLFSKRALASLLALGRRRAFLDACAAIEERYTLGCAPATGACLEDGCAAEGEICLQPLLAAEADYQRACALEWARWFAVPANRIESWRA